MSSKDGGEGDGVLMTEVSEFRYLQLITWCLALRLGWPLCSAPSVLIRRFSQNLLVSLKPADEYVNII